MKAVTLLILFAVAQCLKVMLNVGLSTISHARPLLEMGIVLRDRNHTVIYTSHGFGEKFNDEYQFPYISLGASTYHQQSPRSLFAKLYDLKVDQASAVPRFFNEVSPLAYRETYEQINQILREEQPDVIMCDWMATACRDAAEMNKIPLVTSFQTIETTKINFPFLTNRNAYTSITTKPLTLYERFQDKVLHATSTFIHTLPMINAMNKERSNHGVPPSSHAFGDFSTSLGLSSSFIGFEPAAPIPPHIKLIGPIKPTTNPPLAADLCMFLDTHPRTAYIGFGSDVVLSDFDINNLVVGSLLSIKHGFLDGIVWGLGQTEFDEFPPNFNVNGTEMTRDQLINHHHVRILKWAPQVAILNHKNTRLFLSHGGLEGSFEAILSGTPILCMPFFGDQPRNARKLEDAGVSMYFNRLTTTPCSLAKGIKTMLTDIPAHYYYNVKRMQIIATISSRKVYSGADAVEQYATTARICRHHHPYEYGQIPCELKHLTLASRNMSYVSANAFDVYVMGKFQLILTGLITIYCLHRLANHCSDKFAPNKSRGQE